RVAELLQGRAAQFADEIVKNEGLTKPQAARAVAEAIDRWVWYAGWPDKVAQVTGAANPVPGPYFNFSMPEPTRAGAVLAPPESGLLGLVSVLAPVIATGNTAVVVASEPAPLPAVTLTEVLATSDVPGGVVNILTGRLAELAPVLAAHMDVNAIDLTGAPDDGRAELERLAAGNVKRVFAAEEDWAAPPSPARMRAFLEITAVWHPVGVLAVGPVPVPSGAQHARAGHFRPGRGHPRGRARDRGRLGRGAGARRGPAPGRGPAGRADRPGQRHDQGVRRGDREAGEPAGQRAAGVQGRQGQGEGVRLPRPVRLHRDRPGLRGRRPPRAAPGRRGHGHRDRPGLAAAAGQPGIPRRAAGGGQGRDPAGGGVRGGVRRADQRAGRGRRLRANGRHRAAQVYGRGTGSQPDGRAG